MKVGSLCFSTDRGLGHLARDFVRHGIVTHPAVLLHGRIPDHPEWYPGAPVIGTLRGQRRELEALVRAVDVMLYFETPFEWGLIDYARSVGVKSALVVMYECFPEHPPAVPDLFLCPSLLDLQYFPGGTYLPLPVAEPTRWRLRERAETFVHNAGYIGLRGRHGTAELLAALPHVRSPLKLIVRAQTPELHALVRQAGVGNDPRLTVRVGTVPHADLWDEGDVNVDPEKFNGCSLPLQEARAAGMLVMGTDRFPLNHDYPDAALIPVSGYRRARVAGRMLEFDEAQVEPRDIAATMDTWYGRDVSDYSRSAVEWARGRSWGVLGPKYRAALEGLLR